MEELSAIDTLMAIVGLILIGIFIGFGINTLVDHKVARIQVNIPKYKCDSEPKVERARQGAVKKVGAPPMRKPDPSWTPSTLTDCYD